MVGEFELSLSKEIKLQLPPADDLDDLGEDEEEPEESIVPAVQGVAPQFVPVADATTIKLLKSLRVAAWIIAALLLIVIIK